MIFHCWQFAGQPALALSLGGVAFDFLALAKCGYFGVDLFFVLSGFLLSLPWHRAAAEGRPMPSLRHFWSHRCRRVLPAYWLQLALLVAAALWFGTTQDISWRNVLAQALLIQNIAPWPTHELNAVYWTMPVEWDFYIALPMLALLFRRVALWRLLAFALCWVIAFRVMLYVWILDPATRHWLAFGNVHQLPGRVDQFLLGMAAAWILVNRPLWLRWRARWFAVGVSGLVALAYFAAPRGDVLARLDVPYLFLHHSLTGAACSALVLGAAAGARAGIVAFGNRLLQFLGAISYSLYLWHYPLLQLGQSRHWIDAVPLPAWVTLGLCGVPLMIFVAWLSYRYVERPFLRVNARD